MGAAALSTSSCTSGSAEKGDEDGQVIFIGDNIAIAETTYGKVRGFIHKDMRLFKKVCQS